MLAFTLDTNCLIALEEGRPEAADVQALLARHHSHEIVVRIPGTTAAEQQQNGTYLPNFKLFQQRLSAAGLGDLELLLPICVLGLSYLDWCVLAADDGSDDAMLAAIHSALFTSPYDYTDAVPANLTGAERQKAEQTWRNRYLDGLGLHCHIRSGGDVFVTSDKNFSKATKRAQLAALGASVILTPADAATYG